MIAVELMQQIHGGIALAGGHVILRQVNQIGIHDGFALALGFGRVAGFKALLIKTIISAAVFLIICRAAVQGDRAAVPAARAEGQIIPCTHDDGVFAAAVEQAFVDFKQAVHGPCGIAGGTLSSD